MCPAREETLDVGQAARAVDGVQGLEVVVDDREGDIGAGERREHAPHRRRVREGHVGGEHEDRPVEVPEQRADAGQR